MTFKTKQNMLFSAVSVVASSLSSLLLVPLITSYMGVEAYSYIGLSMVFINVSTVLSLAITSMSTRFVVVSLNNGEDVSVLLSSIFVGCLGISAILLVFFLMVASCADHLMVISPAYLKQVQILIMLLAGSLIASVMASPFLTAQYYCGDLRLYYCFQAASQLSRVAIPWVLFSLVAPQIWYPYACALAIDAVALASYFISFRRRLPNTVVDLKLARVSVVRSILQSGCWVSINKAGSILMETVSTYLTNIFLGPFQTGIFSSIVQLQSFIAVFTNAIVSSLVPNLLRDYDQNHISSYVPCVKKYAAFVGVAICSCSGIALVYAVPFLNLWVGTSFDEYGLVAVTLITSAALSFPFEIHRQALISMNLVKMPALATLVFGLLNIFAAVISEVVFHAGVLGIAFSQGLSSILLSYCFLLPYLCKSGGAKYRVLIIPAVESIAALIASGTLSFLLGCLFPSPDAWTSLLFDVSISMLAVIALAVFYFKRSGILRLLFSR